MKYSRTSVLPVTSERNTRLDSRFSGRTTVEHGYSLIRSIIAVSPVKISVPLLTRN